MRRKETGEKRKSVGLGSDYQTSQQSFKLFPMTV